MPHFGYHFRPIEEVDDIAVNITQADDIIDGLQPQEIVSIVLPSTLFIQITQEANSTRNESDGIDLTGIVFTLYERAVLFPIATDPTEENFIEIGTPVVGADIAGLDVINLTEPFTILLRLNNAVS